MIDIHTHILPGGDDGAETVEKAVSMISILKNMGFDTVFLTPHLNHPDVKTDVEDIKKAFEAVKDELEKVGVDVFLGSECYLTPGYTHPLIPLGHTDLVLVEFPTIGFPHYLENAIFDLQLSGYRVVLAHVERYEWLIKDKDLIWKLRDRNVLFQVNVKPLAMRNENALWYYKNDLIDFLGTDIHSADELDLLKIDLREFRKIFERSWELI